MISGFPGNGYCIKLWVSHYQTLQTNGDYPCSSILQANLDEYLRSNKKTYIPSFKGSYPTKGAFHHSTKCSHHLFSNNKRVTMYLKIKIDGTDTKRLLCKRVGPCKPICRNCAIYFTAICFFNFDFNPKKKVPKISWIGYPTVILGEKKPGMMY